MILQVRLFAVAREVVGSSKIEIQLPQDATVGMLREQLAKQCPKLAELLPRMMIAVGTDYVGDEQTLLPKSDVACIPPVSGG